MPIYFKYDKKKDALYASLEGEVTIEEFQAAIKHVTENAEFAPDVRTLCDVRKLDFTYIDANFLRQVISEEKAHPKRGNARVACIADKDFEYGISRMYEMLADDLPKTIMVFRDYSEGERWLLSEYKT